MAGPDYGASSGDYEGTIRRMMDEAAAAAENLNRKEAEVAATEERGVGVERQARTTRTSLAGATEQLSSALSANIDRLVAETTAVRESTAALERNLATRRAIVATGGAVPAGSYIAGGSARAPTPASEPIPVASGGGGRRPPRPPIVAAGGAFEEDPRAVARLNEARTQLAQAELAAAQARREATQQIAAAARGERVELTATEQLAAARTQAAQITARQLQQLAAINPATELSGANLASARRLQQLGLVEGAGARSFQLTPAGQTTLGATRGPVIDPTVAVETREAARQQAQLARQAVRDAERQVQFNQQITSAKAQQAQADQATAEATLRAAAAAEATAREEEAARVAAQQELEAHARAGAQMLGGPGRLALPAAGGTGLGLGGGGGGGGLPPVVPPGGGGGELSSKELANYRRMIEANSQALGDLEARQMAANLATQEAGAAYAGVSTRLTRHGALTSEFISALARGQVTMRQFGDQMVQTIGKFSGWAIAGAAVYGVWGLFKDLTEGATQTQAAIQNLGRFIPGLGGPAGGGRGGISQAEDMLRAVSAEFNVPISNVADVAQVVARRYPTTGATADVTRAILAAQRLDQIPADQGEQYILGISSSLGLRPRGSGVGTVIGLVNSLNALQSEGGARVAQVLPAVARAAPIARAAGMSPEELSAIAALGVRAGLPGNQVGTALLRSVGTFANRPQSAITLRTYGITPTIGDAGGLYSQVFGLLRSGRVPVGGGRSRDLTGNDIRVLSQALGGPLLGSKNILPILAQEYRQPGTYNRFLGLAEHPRPYTQDLNAVLASVAERFKSIGIALQGFGSTLAQAGLLTPITGLLDGVRIITQSLQRLVSPVADVVGVFNELPSKVRDLIGALVGFVVVRRLMDTRWGGTAQSFFSRLPGLSALGNRDREVVEGTSARLDRELLPLQRSNTERASQEYLRARQQAEDALANVASYKAANPGMQREFTNEELNRNPAARTYVETLNTLSTKSDTAASRAAGAQDAYTEQATRLATMEEQLVRLKNGELDWETRAQFAAQQGYVAAAESTALREQIAAQLDAQLAALRGSTGELMVAGRPGGSVAGVAETSTAGALAGATVMAARTLANNGSAVHDITSAVQRDLGTRQAEQARRTFYVTPQGGVSEAAPAPLSPLERARYAASTATDAAMAQIAALPAAAAARASATARGVWNATKEIAASPAAPFAALLATQAIGGIAPGGVGQYIQNVGGEAATGAMIASMLGRGGAVGVLAGATLGTVAGGFQQSTATGVGAVGGAAVGGIVGGIIGTATDWFSGPLGTAIGAAVGSQVGGLIGTLVGGSPPTPQDIQQRANLRTRQLARAGLSDAALQHDFSTDLASAFSGTGTSQQSAQARVSAMLNRLTATVQLYGSNSPQGSIARRQLGLLTNAAIDQAQADPTTAYQLLQSATQARNQVVSQQFAYKLAQEGRSPNKTIGVSIGAVGQYEQIYQDQYGNTVKNDQQALAEDQAALTRAIAARKTALAEALRKQVGNDRSALQAARHVAAIGRAATSLTEQQAAQQAYSLGEQDIGTSGTLAVAQAGGNQPLALRRQLQSQRAALYLTQAFPSLNRTDQANAIKTQRAAILDTQKQMAQQSVTEAQAQAQLLVSTAPVGDTVAAARFTLQGAQHVLSVMQRYRNQFDPATFAQAIAQVNDAQHALQQAVSDRAIQLIQLSTQLGEAQNYGDAVAQANIAMSGAQRELAASVTPLQRAQARVDIANSAAQQNQAAQQRIQSEGQLQQALAAGNTVQQAQIGISTANALLANAHGIDNQIAAESALAQAQVQYRQALEQRYINLGQLAASTTSDPLRQLRDQMSGVIRALGVARGPDERAQLQTQLNNLRLQYQSTLIGVRESTIDFQLQMFQITNAQAIHQLEGLLHVKDITLQERQQILLKIRQLQQTDTSGGQFDLAPNLSQNLKLPTPYDVSRAIHGANREFGRRLSDAYRTGLAETGAGVGTAAGGTHVSSADTYNYYITVAHAGDVGKVAEVLDHSTGGSLKARVRAAGFRGT